MAKMVFLAVALGVVALHLQGCGADCEEGKWQSYKCGGGGHEATPWCSVDTCKACTAAAVESMSWNSEEEKKAATKEMAQHRACSKGGFYENYSKGTDEDKAKAVGQVYCQPDGSCKPGEEKSWKQLFGGR